MSKSTVKLIFTSLTDKVPAKESLLVFLQPVEISDNYVSYAWKNIPNPGEGTVQSVEITNEFSGAIAVKGSEFDAFTLKKEIDLGKSLSVTNPDGGSPRFSGEASVGIDPAEVGITNDCENIDLSCKWYVNGSQMCVTNLDADSLPPGQTSTFNLKQQVFLKFGVYNEEATYSTQTFSETVEFDIPKEGTVNFEIDTDETGKLVIKEAAEVAA